MNLYIQLINGQPIEHPIFEDNLIDAFPDEDLNNLSSKFAPFNRIYFEDTGLTCGVYQIKECIYALSKDGKTYQDTWSVREMTDDEKTQAIQERKNSINMHIDAEKEYAQNIIDTSTDTKQVGAYQIYLEKLNAYVCDDPFAPDLPRQPFLNYRGVWKCN